MIPLYPGDGDQDGTSATTDPRAIGARAQRARWLIGAPELPIRGVRAAWEGRSGRPRLSIVPPLPESGWLDQDEDGEPRGIALLRRSADMKTAAPRSTTTPSEISLIATLIATGSYPQDIGVRQ